MLPNQLNVIQISSVAQNNNMNSNINDLVHTNQDEEGNKHQITVRSLINRQSIQFLNL